MTKKQQRTIGAIVKIPLANGDLSYAQIIDKASYAFFDYNTQEELQDLAILNDKQILYVLSAYDDIITKGKWLKIGKLPVREELNMLPMQFIQDKIDPSKFRIYDPNTGEITPSSKEGCKGLEQAAVWEAWEIEGRLLNHFEGRSDKTIEEYEKIFS